MSKRPVRVALAGPEKPASLRRGTLNVADDERGCDAELVLVVELVVDAEVEGVRDDASCVSHPTSATEIPASARTPRSRSLEEIMGTLSRSTPPMHRLRPVSSGASADRTLPVDQTRHL